MACAICGQNDSRLLMVVGVPEHNRFNKTVCQSCAYPLQEHRLKISPGEPLVDPYGWTCLKSRLGWISPVAHRRDMAKGGIASDNDFVPDGSAHFVGCCGEYLWHLITGMPMDVSLRRGGDGGIDFDWQETGKTYSIKTSRRYLEPRLILSGKALVADYYVLVSMKYETLQCKVAGWMTKEQLADIEIQPYAEKGLRRAVSWDWFVNYKQTGLPPGAPIRQE